MTRLRRIDWATTPREDRRAIMRRSAVPDPSVRTGAQAICDEIGLRGEAAVIEYAERFGGGFRRMTAGELRTAETMVGESFGTAVREAARAVEAYHRTQRPVDSTTEPTPGVRITRRWRPLDRVGCYVPGGKAAYPSTAIMTTVPARVAGVRQVVVVSPAGDDGAVHPALAAACSVLGVDEVWAIGGAQAIGALAHGAGDLDPVQKIVGPGNAWVTAAKLAVYGTCSIDLPAGPSEVLVIADDSADPLLVAADLLSQAEHGPDSPSILVTDDPTLPDRVERAIDELIPRLSRGPILEQALADHGLVIVVESHDEMARIATAYAGEHVTVLTADPVGDATDVRAAGSIYVGRWSPESAGDYATGANHVLPTGGLAAACGPLAVEDYGSWTQVQELDEAGLRTILPTIQTLSAAEGLDAHGLAASIRFD